MVLWFKQFGSRLQQQLNFWSGTAGAAGVVLTLAGLGVSNPAKKILIGLGVVVFVIVLAVCVVKAWPPPMDDPVKLVGRPLQIADLDRIHPRVPAVGIVGPAGVGKSTLKRRLLLQPAPAKRERSYSVTAHIGPVIPEPLTYIALLDGRGDSYDHQFDIADKADIIIMMLDDSDLDSGPIIDEVRMKDQREFGEQIRDRLTNKLHRVPRIHIILNKKDRWETGTEEEQKTLREFFKAEVRKWETAYGNEVTNAQHSNASAQDMTNMVAEIKEHWRRAQEITKKAMVKA